jgi:hypothetical protein
VRRAYWSLLFRLSKRRILAGIEVGVFLPDAATKAVIQEKAAEAFSLLRDFGPKHLARIRRLSDGVLLFGTVGALGSWIRDARFIRISQDFIADPGTKPIHIAATIAHEATHAWLDDLGFSYTPNRRARIEAICYRAESALARRLPGGEEVALEYEQCARLVLDQPEVEWSDEAFHSRAAEHFSELGVPRWLAKRFSRSSSVLPNERCS